MDNEPLLLENTGHLAARLAETLTDTTQSYEAFREMLIIELGYEAFRDIQKEAFKLLLNRTYG